MIKFKFISLASLPPFTLQIGPHDLNKVWQIWPSWTICSIILKRHQRPYISLPSLEFYEQLFALPKYYISASSHSSQSQKICSGLEHWDAPSNLHLLIIIQAVQGVLLVGCHVLCYSMCKFTTNFWSKLLTT